MIDVISGFHVCIYVLLLLLILYLLRSLSKGDIWRSTLYKTLPKIKDEKIKSRI